VCVFKRVPTPVRRSSQVCNVWVSENRLVHKPADMLSACTLRQVFVIDGA